MKKFLIGIIAVIAIIAIIIFGSYFAFFRPTVPVTPINSNVTVSESSLTKKFIPNDIDLSFSALSATTDTNFSNEELTELSILAIKASPELQEYVTGLKVELNNNEISIYVNIDYKGIPTQAHLVFQCNAVDGKGVFHYKEGKIGFINIPKELLFEYLTDNSIIQINKTNGDIILNFSSIRNLNVTGLSSSNGNLNIKFKFTIKFWDWLKN